MKVNLVTTIVVSFVAAFLTPVLAQPADSKLDSAKVDSVLGRSGVWENGNYVVTFLRPDLRVMLHGVQLAPGLIHSFATFIGTDNDTEVTGDVCALDGEVTAVVEKLRSNGIEITGIHDHFLGESPTLTFVHYRGRGTAPELARAFRAAVAATATALGPAASSKGDAPPNWLMAVENVLGRKLNYSAENEIVSAKVPRADTPAGPMDSMTASSLNFQNADGGRVLAIGDLALTADEVNQAVSALTRHHFNVAALHNHMLDEHPRLFFLHFWKIGSPTEVAEGINAAVAVMHTRGSGALH
jgi:hypothetical protein